MAPLNIFGEPTYGWENCDEPALSTGSAGGADDQASPIAAIWLRDGHGWYERLIYPRPKARRPMGFRPMRRPQTHGR